MVNTKQITKLGALGAILSSSAMAATINYNFDDGTLQGWINNVPAGATLSEDYVADNSISRAPGQSGSYAILEDDFATRDGGDTTVKVLSSPLFQIDSGAAISLYLNGGMGSAATPGANYSNLATTATNAGFLGAALRDVATGDYVLIARKTSNGQYAGGWQQTSWDATAISGATTVGNTYQIDLIDTFSEGWGWTALDTVVLNNVTAVPEPSSAALLGLGGLALLFRRRK